MATFEIYSRAELRLRSAGDRHIARPWLVSGIPSRRSSQRCPDFRELSERTNRQRCLPRRRSRQTQFILFRTTAAHNVQQPDAERSRRPRPRCSAARTTPSRATRRRKRIRSQSNRSCGRPGLVSIACSGAVRRPVDDERTDKTMSRAPPCLSEPIAHSGMIGVAQSRLLKHVRQIVAIT